MTIETDFTNIKQKYLAIKVCGVSHWIWFETSKITIKNDIFVGKSGWGKAGAFTEISVSIHNIEAFIKSDALQC